MTVLGKGIYSVPEAARLTGIRADAIRRWLWGYRYKADGERRKVRPLWSPQHPEIEGYRVLGFRDLIEIRFVKAFLERGVGLRAIRLALERAKDLWHEDYPFSSIHFKTDGKSIFADIVEGTEDGRILMALPGGQLLFTFIVDRLFEGLKYEKDGRLTEWRPLGAGRQVVIDPRRNFGHPAVEQGVATQVLLDAYAAEGSVESVARWFDLPISAVNDAIEFEQGLDLAA